MVTWFLLWIFFRREGDMAKANFKETVPYKRRGYRLGLNLEPEGTSQHSLVGKFVVVRHRILLNMVWYRNLICSKESEQKMLGKPWSKDLCGIGNWFTKSFQVTFTIIYIFKVGVNLKTLLQIPSLHCCCLHFETDIFSVFLLQVLKQFHRPKNLKDEIRTACCKIPPLVLDWGHQQFVCLQNRRMSPKTVP